MDLLHSFKRLIGLKYLRFRDENIFLFGLPLYIFPVKIYESLVSSLVSNFGEEESRKTIKEVGRLQGCFMVKLLNESFSFSSFEKKLNFYHGRCLSIGLGDLRVVSKDIEKGKFKLELKSNVSFQDDIYNYYLIGLILGGYSQIYSTGFTAHVEKTTPSNLIINLERVQKRKCCMIDSIHTYRHSKFNFSLPKNKHAFQRYLKSKKKFKLSLTKYGLKLNDENIILFTLPIICNLYYQFYNLDKNLTKKVFLEIGYEFGKLVYDDMHLTLTKKADFFKLASAYGIGDIKLISLNQKKISVKIVSSYYETISKVLFPDDYSIVNSEFKVGFLQGIAEKVLGNSCSIRSRKIGSSLKVHFELK